MRWAFPRYRRRQWWLAVSLAAAAAVHLAPPAPDLTRPAQSALAVFAMAVVLWVSGAVPLAVTGLAVLGALPLLDVLPAGEVFALFGSPAVFFILGAFVLAAAMMETGLSRRISLFFVVRFGASASRLSAGILVTSAALSCLMPMHAVAAILFPTLATIVNALQLRPRRSRLATRLFLSMAWGCGIGSIATLLGGARAPLAIGILQGFDGTRVGFDGWAVAAAPLALVLLAAGHGLLVLLFRPETEDVAAARLLLEEEVRGEGPLSRQEKKTAAISLLTVLCWIAFGNHAGLATISLVGAFLLFAANAVTWEAVEDNVNWGVLLMYGGAITLGTALTRTGATGWIAGHVLSGLPASPLVFLAATVAATLVLTEFISNAAAVAVLLPVALSMSHRFGVEPAVVMLTVGAASGLAFTLPVGSPPNAIAFSAGYFEVRDVVRAGAAMSLVSFLAALAAAVWYWPLL